MKFDPRRLYRRHGGGGQYAAIGVALFLAFLAFNNQLLFGNAVANWDGDGYFFPYFVLVADFVRSGAFLLWDPWSNGGVPILGDPQVGALSPLTLLVALIAGGSSFGFVVYWLTVWFLGGVGLLLLGRHLNAPAWGSLAIAIGYLFCGVYTGNAQYTSWVVGFSFLPFVVWRLDVAMRDRRVLPAIQAGALWGLSALGGYPGFATMTGVFCAVWAIGRVVTDERSEKGVPLAHSVGFAALGLTIVALVGVVVLAPAYLAFFAEGQGYHDRVGELTRNLAVSGNDLAPGALSTLVSPYPALLKFYYPMQLFLGSDLSSVSIYVGSIPLALAIFALVARPRSAWRWWVLATGVFFLAAALGDALPVRGVLYDLLPPTRYFRHSSLMRAYFLFAIAALAIEGARDLARLRDEERLRTHFFLTLVTITFVAACVVIGFNLGVSVATLPSGHWSYVHLAAAWGGVLVLAAAVRFGGLSRQVWALPAIILSVALADAFCTYLIASPVIFDSDVKSVRRWRGLDSAHRPSTDLTRVGMTRTETPCGNVPCKTNDQLITKVPAFNSFSTEKNDIHARMIEDPALRTMAVGTERIWFARQIGYADADQESVNSFVQRTRQLGAPPLVVTPAETLLNDADLPQGEAIGSLPPSERVPATVMSYRPDALDLRVTAPADGWLLVTDRWARGWEARVNGEPTQIEAGNFLFRAVPVRAGENTIAFTYHPFGFPWLLLLSWGTLAAVAAVSVWAALRQASISTPAPEAEPSPMIESDRTESISGEPEPVASGGPQKAAAEKRKKKRRR